MKARSQLVPLRCVPPRHVSHKTQLPVLIQAAGKSELAKQSLIRGRLHCYHHDSVVVNVSPTNNIEINCINKTTSPLCELNIQYLADITLRLLKFYTQCAINSSIAGQRNMEKKKIKKRSRTRLVALKFIFLVHWHCIKCIFKVHTLSISTSLF